MFLRQAANLIEVHRTPWLSPPAQRARADRALVELLAFTFERNAFHRRRWEARGIGRGDVSSPDVLRRLPVMTKADARETPWSELISSGFDPREGRTKYSSGSSGQPLRIFIPEETFDWFLPVQYRVFSMIGCRPWDRIAYIKANAETTKSYFGLFQAFHVDSNLSAEAQLDALARIGPQIVSAYASTMVELGRLVAAGRSLGFRPKAISLNTEMSTIDERRHLAEIFGCPVFDDYGTEEVWMIASHCSAGEYHVFTDNVLVEIVDAQGEPCSPGISGEVLLTSLVNRAMPFIRYAIGDTASFREGPCPCGRTFPRLASFEGRANDAFLLPSGERVSSAELHSILYDAEFLRTSAGTIRGFQLVQESIDEVVLRVVSSPEEAARALARLCARLTDRLGEYDISYEVARWFD